MPKKTIEDLKINGKRLLVRVDFNVPLDESGRITDDNRIVKSLPTIRYALTKGASIILISHLGRPEGRPQPKYSLRSVAKHLSELLERPVEFLEDCVGPKIEERTSRLKAGEVLLLENLRFDPREKKNDPAFAKELAAQAKIGRASCRERVYVLV